jgi:hypothetical protein
MFNTSSRPDNGLDADDQGYFRLGEGFTGFMDEVAPSPRQSARPVTTTLTTLTFVTPCGAAGVVYLASADYRHQPRHCKPLFLHGGHCSPGLDWNPPHCKSSFL